MSDLEDNLWWQMRVSKIWDGWEAEYRFAPPRRWRFDLAHVELMLAIEVEGIFMGWDNTKKSRHTTASGFTADCEKYNQAAMLGWRVLRFTGPMIKSGAALQTIEQAIHAPA